MINTQTNRQFIEAEQYSQFILTNLEDGLLPESIYRNVSDFGNGETLHIKTIGDAQIQYVEEERPITYTPIESGEVLMHITEYVGDGWYITDKMREDGSQIEALQAARAKKATRAIQEYFETKAFDTLNAAQTAADTNAINGFARRAVASGANATVDIQDLIKMKLAFDKGEVPVGGRIAIVDPVFGATLDSKFNLTYNVNQNPMFSALLAQGWDRDHKYYGEIMGWHIVSSNRLPKIASETIGGTSVTNGVANLFLNIADDQTKALMASWRRMPKVEGERNKDMRRDEFVTTARWGFGVQRVDTLGVLLTSATAIG
jgi:hypothetical protein